MAALVVAAYADAIVTRVAEEKIQEVVAAQDGHLRLHYRELDIRVWRGMVRMEDVEAEADTLAPFAAGSPGLMLTCKRIEAGPIRWRRLIKEKDLWFKRLRIVEPQVSVCLSPAETGNRPTPRKNKPAASENLLPAVQEGDSLAACPEQEMTLRWTVVRMMEQIGCVGVEKVETKGCQTTVVHIGNLLQARVKNLNVQARDIAYMLQEGRVRYNDSLYALSADSVFFRTADGLFAANIGHMETANSGPLVLQDLRCRHTTGKRELAEKMGKLPVTWSDVEIEEVRTSPTAILRMAAGREIHIGQADVTGRRAAIFRDLRYPARTAYKMPQEELTVISVPLDIQMLNIRMPRLEAEVQLPIGGSGTVQTRDLAVTVTNLTNRHDEKMKAHVTCRLGEGKGDIRFEMRNDRACHFHTDMRITGVSGNDFETFLYPMFGMQLRADIKSLQTAFDGDRMHTEGDFCMVYDSMKVHVVKEDVPIKKLARNAGVVNAFAPMVMHERNPRHNGAEPYTCRITNERNPMQNFAAYMAGTIVDGALHTVLAETVYRPVKKAMTKKRQQGSREAEKNTGKSTVKNRRRR